MDSSGGRSERAAMLVLKANAVYESKLRARYGRIALLSISGFIKKILQRSAGAAMTK